jgi:hypothetical protein
MRIMLRLIDLRDQPKGKISAAATEKDGAPV